MSCLRFWVFMEVACKGCCTIISEGPAAIILRTEKFTWKGRQQISPKHYLSTEIASHPRRLYPLMALSFEVTILNLKCSFPYIHNHFVWCAGRGGSDGSKTPKLIDKLQDVDVAKVYCGAQFSLALTKSGAVYSWGKGDTHRLGHASEEHVRFPKLIEVLQGKTLHSTRLAFSACVITKSQSQELTDRHIQNFLNLQVGLRVAGSTAFCH